MPVNYMLSLSEFQMRFIFWISDGCPENETKSWLLAGMQFVRVLRKMEDLEYIISLNKSAADPGAHWKLSEKGEALVALLKLEMDLNFLHQEKA